MAVVREEARRWQAANGGRRVKTDNRTLNQLTRSLRGLTHADCARLIRSAIFDDGSIAESALPEINRAKFELMDLDGVLSFEYRTEQFASVAGMQRLRAWLEQRREAAVADGEAGALDRPKGVLLLGVQGAGKSLTARAVAGAWGLPLLRLDMGALYNKYIGETERNLRESLRSAELMAPCVLWLDEIEKGVGGTDTDEGVSRRVLGSLLTWMAEQRDGRVRRGDRERRRRRCRPNCCARAASTSCSSWTFPTRRRAPRSSASTCAVAASIPEGIDVGHAGRAERGLLGGRDRTGRGECALPSGGRAGAARERAPADRDPRHGAARDHDGRAHRGPARVGQRAHGARELSRTRATPPTEQGAEPCNRNPMPSPAPRRFTSGSR